MEIPTKFNPLGYSPKTKEKEVVFTFTKSAEFFEVDFRRVFTPSLLNDFTIIYSRKKGTTVYLDEIEYVTTDDLQDGDSPKLYRYYNKFETEVKVTIKGECPGWTGTHFNFNDVDELIITVPEGKTCPWTQVDSVFYPNCHKLTYVSPNIFENCTEQWNYKEAFRGTSIKEIQEDWFKYSPKVTNFEYTFEGCGDFNDIPPELFKYNTKVTTFSGTFRGSSAGGYGIPKDLFKYNTEVEAFTTCFAYTRSNEIPEGLFDNNPKVTDFSYCFARNNELALIPSNLFSKCNKVRDFSYCFDHSLVNLSTPGSLIINVPQPSSLDLLNFEHMFELSALSLIPKLWEQYPNSPYLFTDGCFVDNPASNYDEVPSNWK